MFRILNLAINYRILTISHILAIPDTSAASITCSKETGKYVPQYLGRCKRTKKQFWGIGRQKMKIKDLPAGDAGVSDFIRL